MAVVIIAVLEALRGWERVIIYHFAQKRANLAASLGLKQLDLV